MTLRKAQITWILSVFLVILIADQVTKSIVMATIEVNPPRQSDTFFYFSHQRNEGLVGGMFSSNWLVTRAAPFVATLVLAYLFRHLNAASRLQSLAYGLVVGGAIGNLVDRIRLGSVTDFLQFHFYFIPFDFPWKFYPAFNIADSAICVGVVVLVFSWNAGYQQDEPETT